MSNPYEQNVQITKCSEYRCKIKYPVNEVTRVVASVRDVANHILWLLSQCHHAYPSLNLPGCWVIFYTYRFSQSLEGKQVIHKHHCFLSQCATHCPSAVAIEQYQQLNACRDGWCPGLCWGRYLAFLTLMSPLRAPTHSFLFCRWYVRITDQCLVISLAWWLGQRPSSGPVLSSREGASRDGSLSWLAPNVGWLLLCSQCGQPCQFQVFI